jgi:hypothetical protein
LALIAVAGCSHYMFAEREPWRRDAEIACLNSGAVKESPARVRISAIDGPGACGIDFPLKVSALGDSGPLGYTDEPLRPPAPIGDAPAPQQWPLVQSNTLPPPQPYTPQSGPPPYDTPPSGIPQSAMPPPALSQSNRPQPGAPMSLDPAGIPRSDDDDADVSDGPPPYDGTPSPGPGPYSVPVYPPRPQSAPLGAQQSAPLGPPRASTVMASAGPVEVKPAATLACPIVSALDQWISAAVQPEAQRWFGQPVVEIKQISAYSCRGMNGDPSAHISEHAFGNALDIAEFTLADGHTVSVQYGWNGTPQEQGFLHDVQLAACQQFTTVLAPGANIYHYNHIHVDLMRHASGRHICEPDAMSGAVAAARARGRYAIQNGDGVTGSIPAKPHRALGYSVEDNDRLPNAVPGAD